MDKVLDEEVVKKKARMIALQRGLITLGAFLAVTGFIAVIYMSVVGYLTRDLLVDCTTPQGECYRQAQEGNDSVIRRIVNDTIESAIPLHQLTRWYIQQSAACAEEPGVQTMAQIEKCVQDALEKEENR